MQPHLTAATAGITEIPSSIGRRTRYSRRSGHGATYSCPKCTSHAVRRSHVSTLKDTLLRLLWVAPYRCHRCFRRFHRFVPAVRYTGAID